MSDCGYFVDEDDECEVESEAEPRVRYREDLYCPLHIGQVVGQTYRIEHKLGWGGYYTVWLARGSRWRGEHELRMNDEIIRRTAPNVCEYLVTYHAAFYVSGRKSQPHAVLVFPWRGLSMDTVCLQLSSRFRVPAAKRLLLILKHLYAAGVDISIDIGSWSTAEIYQHLGRPRKVLLPEDVGDGELVEPLAFPKDMLSSSLYLGDFGHSLISGTVLKNPIQYPLLFCAPERLHGVNPSFASDMWGFVAILFQLYTGIEITYGDGLTFVSRLVGVLGPFPEQWRGRYPDNAGYEWWYDQTGQMPRTHVTWGYETLEHKLLEDPSFNALMSYYP
ncbi:kinase-like protein [Xylariaceae sp. FL0662B]|nr:kinase-like protein [Xylariaceae sp. FL0662B]